MTIDLQLVEALCGFQKPVQTMDNRTLLITSNPGTPPATLFTQSYNIMEDFTWLKWHGRVWLLVVHNSFWYRAFIGELIKPGQKKSVLGEGMPLHRRPYEKGRLIIQFTVRVLCFTHTTLSD